MHCRILFLSKSIITQEDKELSFTQRKEMSLQLLLIMALVGMCMSMPLHTGDLTQPCEKQGDLAKLKIIL